MQWFKELIIQPKLNDLYKFYDNLELIKSKIDKENMDEDSILALNQFIKDEAANFRKTFADVLLIVEKPLYDKIKANLDELITGLTEAISNDEHKLTNAKTFEKVISKPIHYSKSNLIALIYNFEGTSTQ